MTHDIRREMAGWGGVPKFKVLSSELRKRQTLPLSPVSLGSRIGDCSRHTHEQRRGVDDRKKCLLSYLVPLVLFLCDFMTNRHEE